MMSPTNPAVLSGEPRLPCPTASQVGWEQAAGDKEAWDSLIDHKLVEWGLHPGALADEGFVPPSREVIDLACARAMELREKGAPAPARVVPDGDGGVSFEFIAGEVSISLDIYADLTVELLAFEDCRLVSRQRLI